MGKDRAGEWIDSLAGNNKDLEKRFGVDRISLSRPGGPNWEKNTQHRENYREKMIEGARNDYDLRRTLEAASLSGKKKATKILDKGFNSIGDLRNAQNFSEKAAVRHGQGGAFDSASDYMGLTRSMVERDREKQTQAYEKQFASTDDLNALKKKMMNAAAGKKDDSSPETPSDRLSQVQDRMSAAANDPASLYSNNNADAPRADDQADAARNFLAEYKSDVVEGAGLQQDLEGNLSRASKAVTDIYGR